jgi:hypothetical protein
MPDPAGQKGGTDRLRDGPPLSLRDISPKYDEQPVGFGGERGSAGAYGFEVLAMWETQTAERTEFVYLLDVIGNNIQAPSRRFILNNLWARQQPSGRFF